MRLIFMAMHDGSLTAGDELSIIARDPANVTVADIANLIGSGGSNRKLLRTVSELETLPRDWRDYFRRRVREG